MKKEKTIHNRIEGGGRNGGKKTKLTPKSMQRRLKEKKQKNTVVKEKIHPRRETKNKQVPTNHERTEAKRTINS